MLTVEAPFIGEGREHIVSKYPYFVLINKNGGEVLGGFIYWKKNLSKIWDFFFSQDEKTLEFAETGTV